MLGKRPIPPLVPIFVNAFIAPQPTARRCFQFGQHIARVVAKSPWNVGIIATGGLSHFPELLLGRVGEGHGLRPEVITGWTAASTSPADPTRRADKTGPRVPQLVGPGAITSGSRYVRYSASSPASTRGGNGGR